MRLAANRGFDPAAITMFSAGQKGRGIMLSKTVAGYRAPNHRSPCVMCRHFDAYRSVCSVVEGIVRPDVTCNH
jgi:hypothetical protein